MAQPLAWAAIINADSEKEEDSENSKSELPLIELGLGAGVAYFPDFRGSDNYSVFGLPTPVIVYRGKWLRSSRDEVKALLFDSPRFDINISGGGAVPVDSGRDNGREGMDDLDPTFNVGPSFNWLLSDPENRDSRLRLRLPIRAAFTASFSDFKSLGFLIQPHLRYDHRWRQEDKLWSLSLRAGPLWATRKFHDFYYSVDPQFATSERRAFDASGGYSGFRTSAGILHKRGRLSLGSFASLDHLSGAQFEDSPLVATKQSYVVGLFVAWKFWESETRAPRVEDDDAPAE